MMLNTEVALSKVDNNGSFLHDSAFLPKFSLPRSCNFCGGPNPKKATKWQLSTVKIPTCRITCALIKEDSVKRLVDDELIEKEFKFKPAFDDYVKAMESIKTLRDKNSSQEIDVGEESLKLSSSKPVFLGRKNRGHMGGDNDNRKSNKLSSAGGSHVETRGGKVGQIDRKKDLKRKIQSQICKEIGAKNDRSLWGTVKSAYWETDAGVKDDGEVHTCRTSGTGNLDKNSGYSRSQSLIDVKNYHEMYKERGASLKDSAANAKQDADGTSVKKHLLIQERTYRNGVIMPFGEKAYSRKVDNQTKEANVYELESSSESIRKKTNFRRQESISRSGRRSDRKESGRGSMEIGSENDSKFGIKYVKAEKAEGFTKTNDSTVEPIRALMDDEEGDPDFDDRKAFKTFEEFTDVRGRPRVLRMEMEERIQKLAKWLNGADVNLPEWQFSKIMHNSKIRFTEHTILRVVQILGALGNWRRVLQVVEWLQSRERFKSQKSKYIYTAVLNVLGKARRPVESLNIFHAMRWEFSSYPDLASYHCIAVTLGQAGYLKELFDVIDCMKALPDKKFKTGTLEKWDPRLEPDIVVYNSVLNACVQRKQWEGAFWVLQQLKERHMQPSPTSYGLVMEVMLACGKYNLVHEFFRKVEKASIPSALNYKVLVNTLHKEGKIDEAVAVVQDMERRGIVGSASLYYDLARCLCSAGRLQEALKLIDKICKVATKPLVVTYTGLIQECVEAGSVQNAAYIFHHMNNFCSPNLVTYKIMLKAYLNHGMLGEAMKLFKKLVEGTQHISSISDYKEREVPDKFTFNILLEACVKEKKWDDFENVYQLMLRHGYHFSAKCHLRMVMEASRAAKSTPLNETWKHLVLSSRSPPPPIIKEKFCMELEADKVDSAIDCISRHEELGEHPFTVKAWLDLLNNNSSRFHRDAIFGLVKSLTTIAAADDKPKTVLQNLLIASKEFVDRHVEADVTNLSQAKLTCSSKFKA